MGVSRKHERGGEDVRWEYTQEITDHWKGEGDCRGRAVPVVVERGCASGCRVKQTSCWMVKANAIVSTDGPISLPTVGK